MKPTATFLACVASVALAGAAFAQNAKPSPTTRTAVQGATRTVEAAPTDTAGNHPTDKAADAISGGLPALRGITPSRAELPASAFTKLDAARRGYLTAEDVSQLDGFASAFRAADQNGDGRLNASEFDVAWGIYSGATR